MLFFIKYCKTGPNYFFQMFLLKKIYLIMVIFNFVSFGTLSKWVRVHWLAHNSSFMNEFKFYISDSFLNGMAQQCEETHSYNNSVTSTLIVAKMIALFRKNN